MLNFIKTFRNDEDGAVTVDWVVLTAAVVAMAIGAYTTIADNSEAMITAAGGAGAAEQVELFGATQ
jgi:Flp pilus assembly pilin Flp